MRKIMDTVSLNNGRQMPRIGLGVYKAKNGREVKESVKMAVKHGYRMIDTASFYKNEEGVGEAIKELEIPREELYITTKVWIDEQGYQNTLEAFERSLNKLQLDYLDLYLIHWPVEGKIKETWKALETIYKEGRVRAIGVCNFKPHHFDELMADKRVTPAVNQIELHPLLTQKETRNYCKKHDIKIEAWSPLMRGGVLDHPVIRELADKYHKTPAQIILRWDIESGIITIPKSVHEQRIKENIDIFDFELSYDDVERIEQLNENRRSGPDPDDMMKKG